MNSSKPQNIEPTPSDPAFTLPPIRELSDLLYRGVVGFASCTYVVGFLVVNLHLRRYGVSHIDFIQSEYVFVGAIWFLLVCLVIGLLLYAVRLLLTAKDPRKSESWSRLSGTVIARVVVLATFTGFVMYLLAVLTDGRLKLASWGGATVVGIIAEPVNENETPPLRI